MTGANAAARGIHIVEYHESCSNWSGNMITYVSHAGVPQTAYKLI